ncbi:MAG TPA: holo-ACP synthase [Bacteroidales bacterium]|nr:holo-ACP synthase [Bacteroidales bacterium]
MIFGLGTDIIEVDRIRKTMEADPDFRHQIFSPAEISYCESKAYPCRHYAARFCAKEAFLKALGTGFNAGISLTEIEVLQEPSCRPFIKLTGSAKDFFEKFGFSKILVSLSHLKDIAVAVVIIEKEELRIG